MGAGVSAAAGREESRAPRLRDRGDKERAPERGRGWGWGEVPARRAGARAPAVPARMRPRRARRGVVTAGEVCSPGGVTWTGPHLRDRPASI